MGGATSRTADGANDTSVPSPTRQRTLRAVSASPLSTTSTTASASTTATTGITGGGGSSSVVPTSTDSNAVVPLRPTRRSNGMPLNTSLSTNSTESSAGPLHNRLEPPVARPTLGRVNARTGSISRVPLDIRLNGVDGGTNATSTGIGSGADQGDRWSRVRIEHDLFDDDFLNAIDMPQVPGVDGNTALVVDGGAGGAVVSPLDWPGKPMR